MSISICLTITLWSSSARALEQWFLELREPTIDAGTAQRSVALELGDLEIPGDPRREGDSQEDVSLYFRVERIDDKLIVSLWDRGLYVGRRVISDGAEPKVQARRVGLAAAELAHDLRSRRERERQQVEQEAKERARREAALAVLERRRALGLNAALVTQVLPQGAWLLGPQVGLVANRTYPVRFSGHVRWSAGEVPALSSATLGAVAPNWSNWELGLGAAWVARVDEKLELSLGAELAANVVHMSGATSVDGISGQRDTWGARAGFRFEVMRRITQSVWTGVRFDAGSLLRRIPITSGEETVHLGGLFLGAGLSTIIVPG